MNKKDVLQMAYGQIKHFMIKIKDDGSKNYIAQIQEYETSLEHDNMDYKY